MSLDIVKFQSLPMDLHTRIASLCSYRDRSSLAQTCKFVAESVIRSYAVGPVIDKPIKFYDAAHKRGYTAQRYAQSGDYQFQEHYFENGEFKHKKLYLGTQKHIHCLEGRNFTEVKVVVFDCPLSLPEGFSLHKIFPNLSCVYFKRPSLDHLQNIQAYFASLENKSLCNSLLKSLDQYKHAREKNDWDQALISLRPLQEFLHPQDPRINPPLLEETATHRIGELINAGANIHAINDEGETPLHLATRIGQLETIQILMTHGANIDVKNEDGNTPLHLAATTGQLETIQTLMTHGANIDEINTKRDTPFSICTKYGYLECATYLRNAGASINHKLLPKNRTPLHIAAYRGHIDIVKSLITWNTDLNARDANGDTALHCAASRNDKVYFRTQTLLIPRPSNEIRKGHIEIINLLIAAGANVKIKNIRDESPSETATNAGLNFPHALFDRP